MIDSFHVALTTKMYLHLRDYQICFCRDILGTKERREY